MSKYKIFIASLILLACSRFFPHPPNFTNLIALSFYVPLLFGRKYIPLVFFCFVVTDLFIGFHKTIFFTWISVILIGYTSMTFQGMLKNRVQGIFLSLFIFYILSNFGVWLSGMYTYNLTGLINCYVMAIPFFGNTIVSTVLYSLVIEMLMRYFRLTNFKKYQT
ncbi:MAG: hypothetical protein MRY23_06280 [Pelagibacteraceae bacterium]|nr:hypothetical protein [Pelagibacteraceae bacterium]MCI5078815.1 hypothetical protein [Pelagibacteraceae bacterium]